MSMRFYRFHWADCPEFSADNAWSALWGRERNETGDAVACLRCDGTGEDLLEYGHECPKCDGTGWAGTRWSGTECPECDGTGWARDECPECDGTGWEECLPGYSCFDTPEGLLWYFRDRVRGCEPVDDAGRVVVFEGRQVGTGFDGEDLAIPERVVEELTWSEFVKRHS